MRVEDKQVAIIEEEHGKQDKVHLQSETATVPPNCVYQQSNLGRAGNTLTVTSR